MEGFGGYQHVYGAWMGGSETKRLSRVCTRVFYFISYAMSTYMKLCIRHTALRCGGHILDEFP